MIFLHNSKPPLYGCILVRWASPLMLGIEFEVAQADRPRDSKGVPPHTADGCTERSTNASYTQYIVAFSSR